MTTTVVNFPNRVARADGSAGDPAVMRAAIRLAEAAHGMIQAAAVEMTPDRLQAVLDALEGPGAALVVRLSAERGVNITIVAGATVALHIQPEHPGKLDDGA